MRVAAIYDIHANLPALQAVLEDIRQARVDHIVVGGDVLPGPMPCETIACLREVGIPAQFILGNGDREVLAQMKRAETEWYRSAVEQWRAPVRWNAEQLGVEDEELLASWPAHSSDEVSTSRGFCSAQRVATTVREGNAGSIFARGIEVRSKSAEMLDAEPQRRQC